MSGDRGPASVPPGWYADPAGSDGWRYWDGSAWTAHTYIPDNLQDENNGSALASDVQRQSRRTWPLIAVILVAALPVGLGVGYALRSWDVVAFPADDSSTDVDSAGTSGNVPSPGVESQTETNREHDNATSQSGTQPEPSADEQASDPSPQPAELDDARLPSPQELQAAFERYIRALDAEDINEAYGQLSAELQRQDEWSPTQIATFAQETITGCRVVGFDVVSPASRRVEATVDFDLPQGGVSREIIRTRLERDADGDLRIDAYEVLETERLE